MPLQSCCIVQVAVMELVTGAKIRTHTQTHTRHIPLATALQVLRVQDSHTVVVLASLRIQTHGQRPILVGTALRVRDSHTVVVPDVVHTANPRTQTHIHRILVATALRVLDNVMVVVLASPRIQIHGQRPILVATALRVLDDLTVVVSQVATTVKVPTHTRHILVARALQVRDNHTVVKASSLRTIHQLVGRVSRVEHRLQATRDLLMNHLSIHQEDDLLSK